MKLLRVGKKEKEVPALLDKDNNFRDLSRIIDDLNPQNLTLEIATQFYDDLREIPSDIEDEDDMMEYYEINIGPYDPVIMEIDLQNTEILNKLMQNIQDIKIICPEYEMGGKRRKFKKRKSKRRKTKRIKSKRRKTKKN